MFDGGNANQDSTATLLSMEPSRVGRKVGIGVRVASGILRDRATQTAHSMKQDAPVYAERGKVAAREAKRFGSSIWVPFAHAGGVLWLEITGLFFAIFGIFFAQNTWKVRSSWHAGPEHQHFLVYALITVLFFYFSFSSFYRARRKDKKRKAQRA